MTANGEENGTSTIDRAVSLLTDAHAHPTDDPRLSGPDGIPVLAQRIAAEVRIGRLCAMSSNTTDQVLVKELKVAVDKALKGKQRERDDGSSGAGGTLDFRPCFGYHPWYSHTISLRHPAPSAEEHYRSVFLSEEASGSASKTAKDELEALLPHLPQPRSLQDVLAEIRSNLQAFPAAMLGEVGLDRAFRVPASKSAVKDQTSETELLSSEPQQVNGGGGGGGEAAGVSNDASEAAPDGCNCHTLALRGKTLSSLTIPIEHQHRVLMGQIGLAVEMGRNVSLHSVRAPEATVNLLKECCRVYNGLNKRGFRDINVDLHSCTLSAQVVQQLMAVHPNIYASFSTTINASKSQKSLPSLLLTIPPTRLLVESDWHTWSDLTERNVDMLRIIAPYVVRTEFAEVVSEEAVTAAGASPQQMHAAAEILNRTWQRFERNQAARASDDGGDEADADSDAEYEEEERIYEFEQEWFKSVKAWQAQSARRQREQRSDSNKIRQTTEEQGHSA